MAELRLSLYCPKSYTPIYNIFSLQILKWLKKETRVTIWVQTQPLIHFNSCILTVWSLLPTAKLGVSTYVKNLTLTMATVATGYTTFNKIFHISVSVTKQTAYQELQPEMLQCRELINHGSVLVPPEETVAAGSCMSQEVRLPWQEESSGVWGAATQMPWSTWMGLPRLGVTWNSPCRWRLQLLHKADAVRTEKPRSWLSLLWPSIFQFWPSHYGS